MRHFLPQFLLAVLFLWGAFPPSPTAAQEGATQADQRRRRRRQRRRPPPPPAAEETDAGDDPSADSEEDAEGEAATDADESTVTTGNLRRSGRMEFDTRLVRGQTAGAGAVVLFNRGRRQLLPLTEERTGFSQQTVRDVIGTIEDAEPSNTEAPRRRRRETRRRRRR